MKTVSYRYWVNPPEPNLTWILYWCNRSDDTDDSLCYEEEVIFIELENGKTFAVGGYYEPTSILIESDGVRVEWAEDEEWLTMYTDVCETPWPTEVKPNEVMEDEIEIDEEDEIDDEQLVEKIAMEIGLPSPSSVNDLGKLSVVDN